MKKETIQKGIYQLKHGNYEYPITLQLIKDGRKNKVLNKKINSNIKVTMIHGEKDIVVDVEHSRAMYDAMKKHNKQVEYIELENGDHNMSIEENRLKVLSSLQGFLSRHLPVAIE